MRGSIASQIRHDIGFALRYRNWWEVAHLFATGCHIPHLQPRGGGDLFFPEGSRPLVLMNELWWQDEYGLKALQLPTGATVLDIGANVGVFSWLLLKRFSGIHVHVVEPHPTNFSALKKNLAPWADRVRFHQKAIGGRDGEIEMFVPDWLDAVRVEGVAGPWHTDSRWRPAGTVECCRLSTFIEDTRLKRIDLLKVDIEGAEKEMLPQFSAGLLTNIRQIIMEIHDFDYTGLVKEFDMTFRGGGFSTRIKRVAEDRHLLWALKE